MPAVEAGWPGFFGYVIDYEVQMYRSLLTLVDKHIDAEMQKLGEELATISNPPDGYDSDPYEYEQYLIEQHVEREEHKAIFLRAFFVATISLLEHQLTGICNEAQTKAACPIPVADMRSLGGLKHIRTYLKRLGVDTEPESDLWAQMKHWTRIRNSVVHRNCTISLGDKLAQFARAQGILVEPPASVQAAMVYRIELTTPTCESVLETTRMLLLRTSKAYRDWSKTLA